MTKTLRHNHAGGFMANTGQSFQCTRQGAVDVSIEDGIKAVVLGLAAQESARSGRAVEITQSGLSFS